VTPQAAATSSCWRAQAGARRPGRHAELPKSIRISDRDVGTYDGDFDETIGKADLIFEALAEDLEIETFFERVDKIRRPSRSS
jgi:hypothetical protein